VAVLKGWLVVGQQVVGRDRHGHADADVLKESCTDRNDASRVNPADIQATCNAGAKDEQKLQNRQLKIG
jgi:hypothetical protein